MNALFLGQLLIGAGCAPAFMAAIVFTSQHWPVARFAAISGLVLAIGSGGMLLSATPLAWVIDRWSWRTAFAVLTIMSIFTLLASTLILERPQCSARAGSHPKSGLRSTGFGSSCSDAAPLHYSPLASSVTAPIITIRGLWIVPMFVERIGLNLLPAGNVALLFSISMILGPAIMGHFDPGDKARPAVITMIALAIAATIGGLAVFDGFSLWLDVTLCTVLGFLSGSFILIYAEARSSYPPELTGRGLTALNMSFFLGAAVAQSLSGVIAAGAQQAGWNAINAVLFFLATALLAGTVCFLH